LPDAVDLRFELNEAMTINGRFDPTAFTFFMDGKNAMRDVEFFPSQRFPQTHVAVLHAMWVRFERRLDPRLLAALRIRGGQVGAEIEESRLDLAAEGLDVLVCRIGRGQAERGVQLVDRAVGLDARVVLSDAPAGEQIRLAAIPAAGVELQPDPPAAAT
jgi:hypothetical protein